MNTENENFETDHCPNIVLTGRDLNIKIALLIAFGYIDPKSRDKKYPIITLAKSSKNIISKLLSWFKIADEQQIPIYGYNTGVGSRKDTFIPLSDRLKYQVSYINSHCCGEGSPISIPTVRLMMALRVNSFAHGLSGVTLEFCEIMLQMLNLGIIPVVYKKGSVGASGDLVPLAHMVSAVMGHPEARVYQDNKEGITFDARDTLIESGLKPHILQSKEAMAGTNGSTYTLANAIIAIDKIINLSKCSDIIAAMTIEAIRGEKNAFDARIHTARPHPGQINTAMNIRTLMDGSSRITKEAQEIDFPKENRVNGRKPPRVQDHYSIRCIAQYATGFKNALKNIIDPVLIEMNSATDNPLFFEKPDGTFEALSGGNFHGMPLAAPIDSLCFCLSTLGIISDRRTYSLLIPKFSGGLPADLVGNNDPSNSGFMITQYSGASQVAANGPLSMPACVFNVPTSSGQEDVVSQGAEGVIKLLEVIKNVTHILGIEYLCAAQALSLGERFLKQSSPKEWPLGTGTQAAYNLLREQVPMQLDDRYMKKDMDIAKQLISSGKLVEMVEGAIQEKLLI